MFYFIFKAYIPANLYSAGLIVIINVLSVVVVVVVVDGDSAPCDMNPQERFDGCGRNMYVFSSRLNASGLSIRSRNSKGSEFHNDGPEM